MCHRLAHDVAAPDDNRACALDGDARIVEHTDAARRGAGAQPGYADSKVTDVHGMKSVHILAWVDAAQNFLLMCRNLRGQGQLDEDTVHIPIRVQRVDAGKQLRTRRFCG